MSPVIPGIESQDDWERHRAAVFESLAPVGYLEELHTERIALGFWRLNRVVRAEQWSTFARRTERTLGLASDQAQLETRSIEAVEINRQDALNLVKLAQQLESQADDEQHPVPREHALGLLRKAALLTGIDLDQHEFPNLAVDRWWKNDHWTIGLLRDVLTSLADAWGRDILQLFAALQVAGAEDLRNADHLMNRIARESRQVESMVLPDPATLQALTRYEAHLNRLLNQSLHELEALQARRNGQAAPLARLDIQGLPHGDQ